MSYVRHSSDPETIGDGISLGLIKAAKFNALLGAAVGTAGFPIIGTIFGMILALGFGLAWGLITLSVLIPISEKIAKLKPDSRDQILVGVGLTGGTIAGGLCGYLLVPHPFYVATCAVFGIVNAWLISQSYLDVTGAND